MEVEKISSTAKINTKQLGTINKRDCNSIQKRKTADVQGFPIFLRICYNCTLQAYEFFFPLHTFIMSPSLSVLF